MTKEMKKIIIIILSFILATLTTLTTVWCLIAKDESTFTIKSLKGDNYLTSIKIGATFYDIKDFAKKHDLELTDKKSDNPKIILKNNDELTLKVSNIYNIGAFFELKKANGKISIKYNNKEKIVKATKDNTNDAFFQNNSFTGLLLTKLKSFSLKGYITIIAAIITLTLIYMLLITKMINIFIKIKAKEDLTLCQIIYLYLVYFYLNISSMLPVMEVLHKFYAIVILLQLVLIIYYLKDNLKAKLHNIFSILAIIFSVNMIILLPAFHVPDEFSHYLKAYSIFNPNDVVVTDKPYVALSESTYDTFYKYIFDLHNPEYKTTFKEYLVDSTKVMEGNKTVKVSFFNTYSINPFAYIPSAIIIKLTLSLNLPIILSLILARVINSLIFVLLGYIALKIIPYYKRIFFTMLLLPITIQQTAAVNQDNITLSIIFIFTAIVFKEIFSKEKYISNKSIILIFLLSLCLGISKPGYFFITLLTLLIPKERFKSKKQGYLVKILPLCLCTLLTVSKYFSQFKVEDTIERAKDVVTVGYVLKHPLFLIKICFHTFYQRISLDLLTGQLNLFGWSTVYYGYLLSYIIYFLYTLMLFFDNLEEKILKAKDRLILLAIVILTIGLIYASALFGFRVTTITSITIGALQSRYFIPVTLLLAICVSNDLFKINIKNKNLFNVIVIIFTLVASFYTIINGFYQ